MKPSYFAILTVRQNGGLQAVGARKFSPTQETIDIRKQTFKVDISRPIYRNKKGRNIYIFESGAGQVYTNTPEVGITPKLMRAGFGLEIVSQLVVGLNHKPTEWGMLIWAVMGAFGGLGIGWILCAQFGG
ncbi:MAG: hypothetical protein PHT07_23875 [Paludibacter sp.]|nr:hypothetical protein [Paludibacter sp.]